MHALLEETLKIGDILLLTGFWSDIQDLQSHIDDVVVLNMPVELEKVLPAARRAPHALAILGLVVVLMVSGLVPNVQAALIGCLLMGLLGCVDLPIALSTGRALVLIVGMLPFSLALQRTGGVDLAANAVVGLVGTAAPRLVLATLFVITAVLGLFISNTATAVQMAPVALAIANDLGASPYPFAMIVALAASAAFMTSISSPVNTLVDRTRTISFRRFREGGRSVYSNCGNRDRAARSNFSSVSIELGGRSAFVAFGASFSQTTLQQVRAGDETEIAFDGMPALLSTGILSRLSEKRHLQDPALQQSTVFVHRPLPPSCSIRKTDADFG